MIITNDLVSNLVESIITSGFPMQTNFSKEDFDAKKTKLSFFMFSLKDERKNDVENHSCSLMTDEENEWCKKQLRRAKALASCKGGESHDCFLCGITVEMNITAPRLWFPEMQRYHFADIISSFSTMHCLRKNIKSVLEGTKDKKELFCDYTDPRVIDAFIETAGELLRSIPEDETKWDAGTDETIARLKAILPEGYLQTCRITTNYRQLKTWRAQRHDHRLQEWRDVCKWIDTLPFFTYLVGESV